MSKKISFSRKKIPQKTRVVSHRSAKERLGSSGIHMFIIVAVIVFICAIIIPLSALYIENTNNPLSFDLQQPSSVLAATTENQDSQSNTFKRPSWWNAIPSQQRNFLELLYQYVFVYRRKSDLAHLLEGMIGGGSSGASGAVGSTGYISPTDIPTTINTPIPTTGSVPAPTNRPNSTPTGSVVNPTPVPTANGESHAMMAWSMDGKNHPNPSYDKCDDGTNIVTVHNTFFVVGPDGLKYPTWHPPVVNNPITGNGKCYFGHDHGRDPKGFQFFDDIRQHFAFDANKNGTIESNELASAGIPFGYVNEQILNESSMGFMRHEDHVGHKVEYGNGEGDIGDGTGPFDTSMTGGIVVPVKTGSGWTASGIRCYHFDKIHQGVSTPDAFSNNLHELIIYTNCTSSRAAFPASKTILSGMVAFGAPGEFTRFCGEDRNKIISVGLNSDTQNLPGTTGRGFRNIIDRSCIENYMLVPSGKFSGFPYEIWSGGLRFATAAGKELVTVGGSWEVLDAIRYYNPQAENKISYVADVCYEKLGDKQARGGDCDSMTKNGSIQGIAWNDPRSGFRGLHRGQYLSPHIITNSGGSTYWYTDAMGNKGSTTPFAGSIRQYISSVNTKIDFSSDPRIILRGHNSGGNTVHAPN